MNVVPFVHEGLGNSSYLVGLAGGEALLIDPDRSADRYLREAEARGWRIDLVFETHVHADFVSGVRELAHAAGATLYLPAEGGYRFPHAPVEGGRSVRVADAEVEVIASPSHTPEHVSYAVRTGSGPAALFSGGALIVGGVARTDLIAPELTEPLTRAAYRTLKEAFTALPDETLLYPTHGAGSFCSTGAGGERVSTLGDERATNPALAFDGEEAFVRWLPETFPSAPAYFFRMRSFNQAGPKLRAQVAAPPALAPDAFDAARAGALVVDTRPIAAYGEAHVPGSLSIAFRDSFAVWLGWLVPPETRLLFVTDGEPLDRIVEEALLVGYEEFAGWLLGGVDAWTAAGKPLARAPLVDARRARTLALEGAAFVDVREQSEVELGRVEGALHVPLGDLPARAGELPRDRPVVAYCGHGERAATAVSVLERAGFTDLVSLEGGFEAWREAELPVHMPAPQLR